MRAARIYPAIASGLGLLISTALAAATLATDPSSDYDKRVWTHQDGLPDDRVRAILQTRDGYLWVATQNGLARFDGLRFTVFDHDNTLEMAVNQCVSLAEDANGNLWVSTGSGLIRRTDNRFFHIGRAEGLRSDFPSELR